MPKIIRLPQFERFSRNSPPESEVEAGQMVRFSVWQFGRLAVWQIDVTPNAS
jgi:hypothetical protein